MKVSFYDVRICKMVFSHPRYLTALLDLTSSRARVGVTRAVVSSSRGAATSILY